MSARLDRLRAVSVVVVPMASPPGSTLPLIVLPDAPDECVCMAFHAFLRSPKYRGRSGSWRKLCAAAVALIYDFLHATVPFDVADPTQAAYLIADFAERLLYGTISENGYDPSGLYWPAWSWSRARALLQAVRTYCVFLASWAPADPETASVTRVQALRFWHAAGHSSMPSDGSGDCHGQRWGIQPLPFENQLGNGRSGAGRPLPFPPSLESAFLSSLMPDRGASTTELHIAIRNVLYFLLLLYGGLRKSEPLHLWLTDVHFDPETQGAAVFLYHPETGGVPGHRTTRSEYLGNLGKVPRTRHDTSDRRWAGWKSLLLDENAPEKGMRSRVYWRNRQAGQLFWALHKVYVSKVRPKNAGHPWYFVNLTGGSYGDPLTMNAVRGAFETALGQMELSPDWSLGLALHCMRHGYGQALSDARVKPEVLQICLHQKDPASQLVYTRPFPSDISAELTRAEERIRQGVDDAPDFGALGVRFRSDPRGIFSGAEPLVGDAAIETVKRINRARNNRRSPQ